MSNGLILAFTIYICFRLGVVFAQNAENIEDSNIPIPSQNSPPPLTLTDGPVYNFNSSTNLVGLLSDIRKHVSSKEFEKAHSMAQAALQSIKQTEQNKFYLNQIRKGRNQNLL